MESDFGDCDVLVTDCVLDFSKYLNSSDLPASPQEFFDDLFEEDCAAKGLPAHGHVKVKEEFCSSTSSSRCSTPESLLPEHDFENDFPSPAFSESSEDGLMYQLHSLEDGKNQGFDAKISKALSHIQQQANCDLSDMTKQQHIGGGKAKKASNNCNMSGKRKSSSSSDKKTNEYRLKRERNNVAVRKSRTKAKIKHIETQMKVSELNEENDQLRNKISLLQRELSSLRNFVAANTPAAVMSPKTPTYGYPGAMRNDAPSMYSLIMDKSKQNNHMNRVC